MADVRAKKTVRKEIAEKVIGGKCLQCSKAENNRRGLCNACYLRFNRAKMELPKSKRNIFEMNHIQEGRVLALGQLREIKDPNPFKDAG